MLLHSLNSLSKRKKKRLYVSRTRIVNSQNANRTKNQTNRRFTKSHKRTTLNVRQQNLPQLISTIVRRKERKSACILFRNYFRCFYFDCFLKILTLFSRSFSFFFSMNIKTVCKFVNNLLLFTVLFFSFVSF